MNPRAIFFARRAAVEAAERCLKPDVRNCTPSALKTGTRRSSVMGQWTSFDDFLAPHFSRNWRLNSSLSDSVPTA